MRIEIEMCINEDNIFLNFWNYFNGEDVICEIKNDKLYLKQLDDECNNLPEKIITLTEFCELINSKIKSMKNE